MFRGVRTRTVYKPTSATTVTKSVDRPAMAADTEATHKSLGLSIEPT